MSRVTRAFAGVGDRIDRFAGLRRGDEAGGGETT